jgi:uncharacterized cupin superfamily protein
MKRTGLMIAALALFLFAQAAQADWTPAKRLTWTSGESFNAGIAIDSNNAIHVVWFDNTPGNWEIYYKRSTDRGATWSAAQRLTWSSGVSSFPAIAIDSSNTIHVVWSDDAPGNKEIYYRRSTDGGTTWSAAKRLSWTSGSSGSPAIAIDSTDTIHLVWPDDTPGNWEIYYKRSTDGGTTWSPVKRLTSNGGASWSPAIAIDSSDAIYIVWFDDTPGNYEIYTLRSTDGGATWNPAQRLTWTSGDSLDPVMAIDSKNSIHVVWYDSTPGNAEIYYKRSTDGGVTWSPVKRLTSNGGASWSSAIAVDSNDAIHVVWFDNTPGNWEIYYKRSEDGGATWSAAQRLTWTSNGSFYPAIAIDSTDIIHVVWEDETPGNGEIYYINNN